MTLATPPLRFFNLSMPAEYVAHVEINRPDKLNAFHEPMWYEMRAAFEYLSSSRDVRCVLVSGAGPKAFTAGTRTPALRVFLWSLVIQHFICSLSTETDRILFHFFLVFVQA